MNAVLLARLPPGVVPVGTQPLRERLVLGGYTGAELPQNLPLQALGSRQYPRCVLVLAMQQAEDLLVGAIIIP